MTRRSADRRTVLAAALAAGASAAVAPTALAADTRSGEITGTLGTGRPAEPGRPGRAGNVAFHNWVSRRDWASGKAKGTRVVSDGRPGIVLASPAGSTDYKDPHTGRNTTWEYATWTSPVHTCAVPATESSPPGTPTPRPAPGSRSS